MHQKLISSVNQNKFIIRRFDREQPKFKRPRTKCHQKEREQITINTLSVGQVDEELRQLSSLELEQIYGGKRHGRRPRGYNYNASLYAQVRSPYFLGVFGN